MRISLNKKLLMIAILSMVVTALIGNRAFAISEFKLTASDAGGGHQFGFSVSIDVDRLVVGAMGDNSAYVFRYYEESGWVEEAKLTASDAAAGDEFGFFVSIDGERVVVGARHDADAGEDSGSAYVFRYYVGSGWVEEAKLTASDAAAGDEFGYSVSIDGDRVVVGAYKNDSYTGAAYVFRYYVGSGWVEETKLTASDGGAYAFGGSVSIDGERVVVGAISDPHAGENSGSAYVFWYDGSGWVEETKLTASDAAENDRFGHSVSIDGERVVVGAPYDTHAAPNSGSAYVFWYDGSGWVEEAKLTASDAAENDNFGFRVSIDGDGVAVGAPGDDEAAPNSGSAYAFWYDGSSWVEEAKLKASDAAPGDNFGYSVSIGGGRVLAGSRWDDDAGDNSGSAYVFTYLPVPQIKVNGQHGPVYLTPVDFANITVSLDPGVKAGQNAEWWIGILTAFGSGVIPLGQIPIFELPEISLFNIPLPEGFYMFFFVLDDELDGTFDIIWYDYVVVICSGAEITQMDTLPDFEALFQDKIKELMRE